VFFDSGIERFPSSGCPVDATHAEKAAGIAFAREIQPYYGTCLRAGLLAALEMAERSTAPIREPLGPPPHALARFERQRLSSIAFR
jgi:hypothetical protein